jgi:hypothetical protein
MSNKQITAVEWLAMQLYDQMKGNDELFTNSLIQAKAMEKEQMKDFAIWFWTRNNEYQSYENIVEQYYKETYEQ